MRDNEGLGDSYCSYLHTGQPGTVTANHDGPNWNRRPNYRRKGKRGYVHVAHLRRAAKRHTNKQRRQRDKRVTNDERE